jgi:2-methylaconitate cis-trans-isomerase PrpF
VNRKQRIKNRATAATPASSARACVLAQHKVMDYRITFNNPGGELDSRTAATPEEAAKAAIEMIQTAGALYEGDSVEIQGEEE